MSDVSFHLKTVCIIHDIKPKERVRECQIEFRILLMGEVINTGKTNIWLSTAFRITRYANCIKVI